MPGFRRRRSTLRFRCGICSGFTIALTLRRSRAKPEIRKDGLPRRAGQKLQERLRLRLSFYLPRRCRLFARWARARSTGIRSGLRSLTRESGGQNGVGVSAIEELQSLADVFAVDDLLFDGGPEAGVLERLLGGRAVGSQAWIGQRYETNPILR